MSAFVDTNKAAESEDIGSKRTESRRHSVKYGSTLSLGSQAVKESLRSVVVQKTNRTFGIELKVLVSRERELSKKSIKEHPVPTIVSTLVGYLKEHSKKKGNL